MKLEIFDAITRTRVDMIRTYNYVQYVDEYNGLGSFEVHIPTTDPCLQYLTFGAYIYFEEGIVGIVKGIKDVENSDVIISVYGYLTNSILTYRSFLLTTKYYDKVELIARQMVSDLFINPTDVKRKVNFITLSTNQYYINESDEYITVQNTGDTLFDVLRNLLPEYNRGFKLYPVISNVSQANPNSNISALEFRVTQPIDRTIGNPHNNIPVVFSFDLSNLSYLEYEEDGRVYNSVAIVASYGRNEERKVIEVGETQKTGIERIELYVDARDLQPDGATSEEPLTDEELEELMRQRGLEKLEEHIKFISVDGTIVTGSMQYKYGLDFNNGDWVSVYSKKINKIMKLQITSVIRSISEGVEIFDISFGKDRLSVSKFDERKM